MATKRNADAVHAACVRLLAGDAQDPPAGLGPFDAIFCCNVWMFWHDQLTTIGQLSDLLSRSGVLAITHLPRSGKPTRAHTEEAAQSIETQMHDAGLAHTERHYLDLEPAPPACIIGTTPPSTPQKKQP